MTFHRIAGVVVVAVSGIFATVAEGQEILDQYDQLCVSRGEGDGQALVKCKAAEVGSAGRVMKWLGSHGLVKSGRIDFPKINGVTDMSTPAGIAGACFLKTGDWIDIAACFKASAKDFQ